MTPEQLLTVKSYIQADPVLAPMSSGTDANIIPLTMFDFVQTPSGADIQMTTGVFYRAT